MLKRLPTSSTVFLYSSSSGLPTEVGCAHIALARVPTVDRTPIRGELLNSASIFFRRRKVLCVPSIDFFREPDSSTRFWVRGVVTFLVLLSCTREIVTHSVQWDFYISRRMPSMLSIVFDTTKGITTTHVVVFVSSFFWRSLPFRSVTLSATITKGITTTHVVVFESSILSLKPLSFWHTAFIIPIRIMTRKLFSHNSRRIGTRIALIRGTTRSGI